MEISDLDMVCKLENSIFPDPWSRNNFLYEIEKNEHSSPYVALDGRKILGYSVHWCLDIEAHIANFAVDNNFRRRNVGSFLLGYVISDIVQKKIHKIYLELRSSNLAAKNLYVKHGFQMDGIRKNYYLKQKDDAILMSLTLKEG